MMRVLPCMLAALLVGTPPASAQTAQIEDCSPAGNSRLSTTCEFAFASYFAPVMAVRSEGCNWNTPHQRLGGGYFFAAERVDSVVRLAYLPAYFKDCGWSGIKCWIPGVDCASHTGDSEFIVLDLVQDSTSAWRVSAIFLSAHCFGRSGSDCRWYRGGELSEFTWHDSVPEVWVSEGRNANYPSRDACDKGHHSIDTCDHHDVRYRFPVSSDKNIGTRDRPSRDGGCYSGADIASAFVEDDAVECFWETGRLFRGWKADGPGVTGYERYLGEIAKFRQ